MTRPLPTDEIKGTEPAITAEEAANLREQLKMFSGGMDRVNLELGRALAKSRLLDPSGKPLYKGWGFSNFGRYVECELSIRRRKAENLLTILDLVNRKILPEDLVAQMSVAKIARLLPLVPRNILTAENAREWLGKATTASFEELKEVVSTAAAASGKAVDKGDLPDVTPDPVWSPGVVFVGDQIPNVQSALAKAQLICQHAGKPSDKKNHLLDCICTAFNATHIGRQDTVDILLNSVERGLDVQVLAWDRAGNLVYGAALADKLMKE